MPEVRLDASLLRAILRTARESGVSEVYIATVNPHEARIHYVNYDDTLLLRATTPYQGDMVEGYIEIRGDDVDYVYRGLRGRREAVLRIEGDTVYLGEGDVAIGLVTREKPAFWDWRPKIRFTEDLIVDNPKAAWYLRNARYVVLGVKRGEPVVGVIADAAMLVYGHECTCDLTADHISGEDRFTTLNAKLLAAAFNPDLASLAERATVWLASENDQPVMVEYVYGESTVTILIAPVEGEEWLYEADPAEHALAPGVRVKWYATLPPRALTILWWLASENDTYLRPGNGVVEAYTVSLLKDEAAYVELSANRIHVEEPAVGLVAHGMTPKWVAQAFKFASITVLGERTLIGPVEVGTATGETPETVRVLEELLGKEAETRVWISPKLLYSIMRKASSKECIKPHVCFDSAVGTVKLTCDEKCREAELEAPVEFSFFYFGSKTYCYPIEFLSKFPPSAFEGPGMESKIVDVSFSDKGGVASIDFKTKYDRVVHFASLDFGCEGAPRPEEVEAKREERPPEKPAPRAEELERIAEEAAEEAERLAESYQELRRRWEELRTERERLLQELSEAKKPPEQLEPSIRKFMESARELARKAREWLDEYSKYEEKTRRLEEEAPELLLKIPDRLRREEIPTARYIVENTIVRDAEYWIHNLEDRWKEYVKASKARVERTSELKTRVSELCRRVRIGLRQLEELARELRHAWEGVQATIAEVLAGRLPPERLSAVEEYVSRVREWLERYERVKELYGEYEGLKEELARLDPVALEEACPGEARGEIEYLAIAVKQHWEVLEYLLRRAEERLREAREALERRAGEAREEREREEARRRLEEVREAARAYEAMLMEEIPCLVKGAGIRWSYNAARQGRVVAVIKTTRKCAETARRAILELGGRILEHRQLIGGLNIFKAEFPRTVRERRPEEEAYSRALRILEERLRERGLSVTPEVRGRLWKLVTEEREAVEEAARAGRLDRIAEELAEWVYQDVMRGRLGAEIARPGPPPAPAAPAAPPPPPTPPQAPAVVRPQAPAISWGSLPGDVKARVLLEGARRVLSSYLQIGGIDLLNMLANEAVPELYDAALRLRRMNLAIPNLVAYLIENHAMDILTNGFLDLYTTEASNIVNYLRMACQHFGTRCPWEVRFYYVTGTGERREVNPTRVLLYHMAHLLLSALGLPEPSHISWAEDCWRRWAATGYRAGEVECPSPAGSRGG